MLRSLESESALVSTSVADPQEVVSARASALATSSALEGLPHLPERGRRLEEPIID